MKSNLSSAALVGLLSNLSVQLGVLSMRPHDRISLDLPPELLSQACQAYGINMHDFVGHVVSRFPRVDLTITPELHKAISVRGIYGDQAVDSTGKGIGLGNTYYLSLQRNGRLLVKYQKICGSWAIATLTQEQLDELLDRIGKEIKYQLSVPAA